jgi:hypothetical protein
MTRRLFPLFVTGNLIKRSVSAAAQERAQGQDDFNGHVWTTLTGVQRASYVLGFTEGTVDIFDALHDVQGDTKSRIKAVETMLSPGPMSYRDFAHVIDRLYEDPANLPIGVRFIWTVASMRIRGRSQTEIDAALTTFRKLAFDRSR